MRAVIAILFFSASIQVFAQGQAVADTQVSKAAGNYLQQKAQIDNRVADIRQQNSAWEHQLKQEIDEVKSNQQELSARLASKRAQLAALNEQLVALNQQKQQLTGSYQLAVDDMQLVQGAYQKALSSLTQQWQQSSTSLIEVQREQSLAVAKASSSFPSLSQLNELIGYAVDDMQMTAQVARTSAPISQADGSVSTKELLVFGGLMAVTDTDLPSFIAFTDKLPTAITPVDTGVSLQLKAWIDGETQLLAMDLSQGRMLPSLAQKQSVGQWVKDGGEVLWPILILAALGLLIALWRAVILLYWRPLAQLQKDDSAKADLLKIKQQLQSVSRVPAAKVLANAIVEGSCVDAMDQRLKQLMLKQMAQFERGLGFIALLAAMAPMLGLLGTVSGMIETFQSLTEFGNSDPKLLSQGISKALITTQAGLLVALPLLLLHYPLKRRAQALSLNMEQQSALLLALNLEQGECHGSK
ncbi:MotA/TolQ/ExbB proton channel family protein [Shewanella pealeana]|uniref:MotA/TolQ/ExbB proton channel n=1 Tax=Shewanella pealeana (strain ATCC 700345 / ANG-SQ1) TaxID=398579 RepID=A8H8F0_SHEPA|nr:MotA/TolQ/ExbB proton channel family protein [Shewanella pealeana]ABV88837.1 MotA/TolQ/ExbB proton channel [Shewanella pealeana ATCC 700345]